MTTTPVVLDEDTYTEALSAIIERDFYPQLSALNQRHNYAGAALQTDGLSDLGTPMVQSNNTSKNEDKTTVNYYNPDAIQLADRVNLDLSLDQFQTVYTSEDNASFTDIIDKTNARQREKYRWLLDKEAQIESSKRLLENHANRLEVDDDGFVRPPEMWRYKAKNALMYVPDGTGKSLLNEKDSRAPQKSISYNNTNFTSSQGVTSSNGRDIPASGTILPEDDNESITSEMTMGYRGYRLVDATPSPNPSRIGTPIMTWGSIEGSPTLLNSSETPGPRFSLPKVCKREELGMKLSEKASRARRKRTMEKSVRRTPITGTMSPAAEQLLRRSGTPKSTGFGQALRSSYGHGATPRSKFSSTPLFKAGATPSTLHSRSPFPQQR
ncbi:hypothetical protein O0I10_008576 [Lichtheimia ornata]|uniref:Uncharacterized protein n=1 Tax=Lichtheimia ornata TaxID=688661 RepID=A0AAD7V0X4_9FUNG|nr:uncharacterized protein O0I10_008576 [Lichtheimia ornata]KAJ8655691.1 hypothetical protein O0I10_008576 [Lichtheimia ornata]